MHWRFCHNFADEKPQVSEHEKLIVVKIPFIENHGGEELIHLNHVQTEKQSADILATVAYYQASKTFLFF